MAAGAGQTEIPRAVPAARWKAREEGVDLSLVKGSGPGGVILPRDLDQFRITRKAVEAHLEEEKIRASTLARRLAEREGVSLENIGGTGTRGRIMMADVERADGKGVFRSTGRDRGGQPLWKDDSYVADEEGYLKADGPERLHSPAYLLF